jgi:nicotinamide mononucleotide transporter
VNLYEIFGVLFGIVGVWLTVRENIWCWPVGLVNVSLFIIVFYQAKLYADMGLQVIYVALCLYGWHEWLHGGPGRGELSVSRAPTWVLAAGGAGGTVFAALLGLFLRRHTDAALPFWDSSTTSFSLVAQWLQTRKWLENWVVWMAVDGVYVGIYIFKHLYLTAGLYAVFLALAVMGLAEWQKSLATKPAPA